jgi:hypothetical protein
VAQELDNFLARGAWVLADCREHLRALNTPSAFALCERIDDYFSDTLSWLRSHPSETSAQKPSSIVGSVDGPGLGWKGADGNGAMNGSLSDIYALPAEEEVSSTQSLSKPALGTILKKTDVDFF